MYHCYWCDFDCNRYKEMEEHRKEKHGEKYMSGITDIQQNAAVAILAAEKKEGIKHDQAKPDLSLLPAEFLVATAQAFMHGEAKYGRYNYRNGMDWHRILASALRHLVAWNEGQDLDPESGYNHLGHVGACIAMLLVYQAHGLGKDTRYENNKK